MATINTAQKAPLTIVTAAGAPVGPLAAVLTVAGTAVTVENQGFGDGTNYVIGQEVGTATVTATYQGQTGTLEVIVTAAPLAMTLGDPVAK